MKKMMVILMCCYGTIAIGMDDPRQFAPFAPWIDPDRRNYGRRAPAQQQPTAQQQPVQQPAALEQQPAQNNEQPLR